MNVMLSIFLLVLIIISITSYVIFRYRNDISASTQAVFTEMTDEILTCQEANSKEDILTNGLMASIVEQYSTQNNLYVYVADENSMCVYCSKNTEKSADFKLRQELIHLLSQEDFYISDSSSGKVDLSLPENVLSCGQKLSLYENGVEHTFYVFANYSLAQYNDYISDCITFSIIIMVMSGIICGTVIFFITYSGFLRIAQLGETMEEYSRGNYDHPINQMDYEDTELQEIAKLVENINSLAMRSDEASRQFVSNVSHELRTPMTVISGFVDGIIDGTIPKNKRDEYLYLISQEVQRLKILVTSMLNLTKFDEGTIKLNCRRFTVNDLAMRTILMFQNRLEKRGVEVEGLDDDPIRMYADPDLFHQVIYNLVENAVKFVDDNGKITFTFKEVSNGWIFAIRNTGKGIPRSEQPKIFERFYKSDFSRSLDKTGLGLGLDITRKIVYLHNGEIRVSSEENVYTEFEVRIPFPQDLETLKAKEV